MRSERAWFMAAICVMPLVVLAAPARAQDRFNANTGGGTAGPCEQTYLDGQRQIVTARMLNDAQYKKAKIDCNGKSDCIRAAQKQYETTQRDIAKQQTDASAQHDICRAKAQMGGGTLPAGAVVRGDPDAADAGVPGFVGSFPGTKSGWGSYCYTYLCERNIWNVSPFGTDKPQTIGHATPRPGDAVVVFQKIFHGNSYTAVHFAVYEGHGIFYQRNGASSVEVVNSRFFQNYKNAVVRYVDPKTGK